MVECQLFAELGLGGDAARYRVLPHNDKRAAVPCIALCAEPVRGSVVSIYDRDWSVCLCRFLRAGACVYAVFYAGVLRCIAVWRPWVWGVRAAMLP
jgi:hypothetical protein